MGIKTPSLWEGWDGKNQKLGQWNKICIFALIKVMVMVITLKQGATKRRIQKILENLKKEVKPKGVDVYRYCGKISLKKDALEIQKELRNEW